MESKQAIRSFEDLDCWKVGTELRRFLSPLIRKFPKEEFSLKDQMLRASRSITNNIAEGYGRFHFQENIQSCRQSRGSAYEIRDQLIIALDEEFISRQEFDQSIEILERFLRLINGYINYLAKAKQSTQ